MVGFGGVNGRDGFVGGGFVVSGYFFGDDLDSVVFIGNDIDSLIYVYISFC